MIQKQTQRAIAELLGVSERAYQHYEAGTREPNIASLVALADYFDVSIDYLVGRLEGEYFCPDKLRDAREQRGFLLEEVSELSGISQALLKDYENGKKIPSNNEVECLSRVLNITSHDIIDNSSLSLRLKVKRLIETCTEEQLKEAYNILEGSKPSILQERTDVEYV
jgi:transcriptional regulator with XRE-family HTH domain